MKKILFSIIFYSTFNFLYAQKSSKGGKIELGVYGFYGYQNFSQSVNKSSNGRLSNDEYEFDLYRLSGEVGLKINYPILKQRLFLETRISYCGRGDRYSTDKISPFNKDKPTDKSRIYFESTNYYLSYFKIPIILKMNILDDVEENKGQKFYLYSGLSPMLLHRSCVQFNRYESEEFDFIENQRVWFYSENPYTKRINLEYIFGIEYFVPTNGKTGVSILAEYNGTAFNVFNIPVYKSENMNTKLYGFNLGIGITYK